VIAPGDRHATLGVEVQVLRYSHLAPDQLRAAVAVLDGVLSSSKSEPAEVSAQDRVALSGVSAN